MIVMTTNMTMIKVIRVILMITNNINHDYDDIDINVQETYQY